MITINKSDNQNPRTIFCYLCGRQFGTTSFKIHHNYCSKKAKIEKTAKKTSLKRSNTEIDFPSAPKLHSKVISSENCLPNLLKQYNEEAAKIFKYQVLSGCKYCGRTFNPESLLVHEKGCDQKNKKQSQPIITLFKQYVKPKTLVCCICGREFGTKSLRIHYPQCLEKFNQQEVLKHRQKKNRSNAPQLPQQNIEMIQHKDSWTNEEIEQFNKKSMNIYRQKVMKECENCGRKFVYESYLKHRKNCIMINGNKFKDKHLKKMKSLEQIQKHENNVDNQIQFPKVLFCHICGKEFGLTSLHIHQKTCSSKFKTEQKKKPIHVRKQIPQLINKIKYQITQTQKWSKEDIQNYNENAKKTYHKISLSQCHVCGRSFFEDSLPKHLKYCQKYNQKNKNQAIYHCNSAKKFEPKIQKAKLLICHICGRQFSTFSLCIHQKQCKKINQDRQKLKQQDGRKLQPSLKGKIDLQEYNIDKAMEWSIQKIISYNQIASNTYYEEGLKQCVYCHRRFFEDSLLKHIKYCQKQHTSKQNTLQAKKKINDHIQNAEEQKEETFHEDYSQIPFKKINSQQNNQIESNLVYSQKSNIQTCSIDEYFTITYNKPKEQSTKKKYDRKDFGISIKSMEE